MLSNKDRRFTFEGRVGTQGSIGINDHVQRGAMPGVLDITNTLENIND